MALLHRLPVQSGEQAVTLQEGQEIVGTWRVTAASATFPKKSSYKRTTWQTLRGGGKKPERKLENNAEMDVTPLLGYRSGWEPKSLSYRSQSRAYETTHWQKTRPSSQGDLSHASIVYLYFSCRSTSPLTRTLRVCVSLSLWTCFASCSELDLGFTLASQPAYASINLLVSYLAMVLQL